MLSSAKEKAVKWQSTKFVRARYSHSVIYMCRCVDGVMYELNHFMFYLSIHLTSIFVSYGFHSNHKIQPLAMGMLAHVIHPDAQCTKCRYRFLRLWFEILAHFLPCVVFIQDKNSSDIQEGRCWKARAKNVIAKGKEMGVVFRRLMWLPFTCNKTNAIRIIIYCLLGNISGSITTQSKECHQKCQPTKWQKQMSHEHVKKICWNLLYDCKTRKKKKQQQQLINWSEKDVMFVDYHI